MTLRLGAAGCKLKARVRRDVELLPEPGLLLPAPVSASPKPEAHVHFAKQDRTRTADPKRQLPRPVAKRGGETKKTLAASSASPSGSDVKVKPIVSS